LFDSTTNYNIDFRDSIPYYIIIQFGLLIYSYISCPLFKKIFFGHTLVWGSILTISYDDFCPNTFLICCILIVSKVMGWIKGSKI